MNEKTTYTGQYISDEQEVDIEIINDFYDLSFALNGVLFTSSNMEEWLLDDSVEYTEEQLNLLALSSVTFKEGFNLVTKYNLTDCKFSFAIPQRILDKKTADEKRCNLNVSINLGREKTVIDLSLNMEERDIEISDIGSFETGLAKISKEINKTHILFNCLSCRYSSYNVYGQGMFGGLLCYKKHKERFVAIKDKTDYLKVQEQGYETVQETSYCEEFQMPQRDQFLYK